MAQNFHMKRLRISIVYIICLLISCTDGDGQYCRRVNSIASLNVEMDEKFLNYDLKNQNIQSMWDEVDSVFLIRLDQTENSLIGNINSIYIIRDTIYIADIYGSKTIKCFDINGNYLQTIGRVGHGKGEYVDIHHANVYDCYIDVLDQISSRIVRYTKAGDYVKDIQLKDNPSDYLEISPNNIVLIFQCYSEKHPYRVEFVDSLQNVVNTALPFTNTRDMPPALIQKMADNSYNLNYPLCDTIYNIYNGSIKSKCRCILNDNDDVDAFYSNTSNLSLKDFLVEYNSFKKNIRTALRFYESDGLSIATHKYGDEIYQSLIYKNKVKTAKALNIAQKKCDFPFMFYGMSNGCMISCIDSNNIGLMSKKCHDNLKKYCLSSFSEIQNYSIEDNPILCLIKFKNYDK